MGKDHQLLFPWVLEGLGYQSHGAAGNACKNAVTRPILSAICIVENFCAVKNFSWL
jgi:hypothetical protein